MNLLLAQTLDGDSLTPTNNRFGYRALGPLALLELLELYLGLSRPAVSASERIVQYRAVVAPAAAGGAFFAETYKADPIGTVKELLNWRDTWYLNGWSGSVIKDNARLQGLSSLETEAKKVVAPSVGERLNLVANALRDGATHPIQHIQLVDNLSTWPTAWQAVLQILQTKPTAWAPPPHDPNLPLLAKLQEALAKAVTHNEHSTLPWQADNSIEVWQAPTV